MLNYQTNKNCVTIFTVLTIIFTISLFYNYFQNTPADVNEEKFTLLGPYSRIEDRLNDVYDQLIDIEHFSFITNSQPCEDYKNGLLLIIIVSSKPENVDKRIVIRKTWGRPTGTTKVVFLLGEFDNTTTERTLQKEIRTYGDIVQGSFKDAYRNMTYKHVMGLKWVSHHCSTAKYVLKTDDDVVVNSHSLRQYLVRRLSPWGAKGLIMCQVWKQTAVERQETSKWRVSEKEYPHEYYPDYCAGWAILYSQDVVQSLLSTAQQLPYFWIDDVYITGIIANKINVDRIHLDTLILSDNRVEVLTKWGWKYAGLFLFGPPQLSTDKIIQIWKAIPHPVLVSVVL